MISVIGKGSYGKVMLVKKKDTGQRYAMKVLKKEEIIRRNQVEHTMTERRILVSEIHEYNINLIGKYQTSFYSKDGLRILK
jgi:serine/threonine protein kinase